ncbi:hypothetical protein CDL15_Pgr008454 [Punica granatum]|uniref:Uncharacterized protein n=1 Tax=Punica granatum TaxID=22663 RepID=A0A218WNF0_PUNGR|nr:hypothetical protein CDL15_Pgr008454 [Punica granatum]PKI48268.1 hypothetical protein CRG98_031326 [Punica granatum]
MGIFSWLFPEKNRWPELIEKNGDEAVVRIAEEHKLAVHKIKYGEPISDIDYNPERVRVFVNAATSSWSLRLAEQSSYHIK